MTDFTVTGGRISSYPTKHYGGHFKGGTATYILPETDLAEPDSNVLAVPNNQIIVVKSGTITCTPKLFGITVQQRANDNIPFAVSTVRSHDLANGVGRWQFIEPSDNVWTGLAAVEAWVNAHYAAGRDIIFTLFGTPTWASARPSEDNAYAYGTYGTGTYGNYGISAEPTNMAVWDRFCTKMATTFLGKVKYYEVWNEPNMFNIGAGPTSVGANVFFGGTFAKLAEMTRRANVAIKAIDPTAKIICPAVTNWVATSNGTAEQYFTGMMSASTGDGSTTMKDWVDIVGVHLYQNANAGDNTVSKLTQMIDRINAAKTTAGVSAKETWDTESAPITVPAASLSDASLKRWLSRMFITMAAKGINRSVYYQLDSSTMGFYGREAIYSHWDQLQSELLRGKYNYACVLADGRLCVRSAAGITII